MVKKSGLLHRLPGEEEDMSRSRSGLRRTREQVSQVRKKGKGTRGLGLLWVKEDKGSGLLHRLPGKEEGQGDQRSRSTLG